MIVSSLTKFLNIRTLFFIDFSRRLVKYLKLFSRFFSAHRGLGVDPTLVSSVRTSVGDGVGELA